MDYNNREWVLMQRERIRSDVQKYKDHPALLIWSLGNELDLDYKNIDFRHKSTVKKSAESDTVVKGSVQQEKLVKLLDK